MVQKLIEQLEEVIAEIGTDVAKFDEKGNKAAGTRIRKAMQTVKGLAQDVRVAISDANKA
jgi:hypothetical protein